MDGCKDYKNLAGGARGKAGRREEGSGGARREQAFEQGEDGLEVGVFAIDGVVELAAFDLGAEEAFAGEAGEFAGEVGGVDAEADGQLADVDARGSVDVEEREDLAAEPPPLINCRDCPIFGH